MSTKEPYLLVKPHSALDDYYHEDLHLTGPIDSNIPLVWWLSNAEVWNWTKLFTSDSKYEGYTFRRVILCDQVTVAGMEADYAIFLENEAKRKAEEERQAEIRKKKAEEKRAKKAKQDLEKLSKDDELRKQLYNKLKQEFEADGK